MNELLSFVVQGILSLIVLLALLIFLRQRGRARSGHDAVQHELNGRKQTNETLSASEKRFRALIENSTDGIALVGADATVLYVSPSNERIYGYSTEEIIHQNGLELVHPDDRAVEMAHWAKLLERPGEISTSQCRVRHKDGSWRWTEIIRKNLLAEPDVQAIVVNYRDITERKRAEESLRESEERYRNLVELSPDMIVVHSEGKIIYINPAGVGFLGAADPQQLIGKSLLDLVHPDFRRTLAERLEPIYSGRERRFQIETRFVRLDGQVMDIEVSSVPITYEGKAARQVIARDISERKRAEERLVYQSQLLANVHDAIIATDEHFTLTEWNRAAEQMYGWKAEEAIGRKVNEVIPTEFTDAQFAEALRLFSETGRYRVEVVQYRRDGKPIDVEGTTMALRDANGPISGYVSVNRDITERRQAEAALHASEKRFHALIENASDVVALVSANGTILYESSALTRVLGYTVEERTNRAFFELVHPDDLTDVTNRFAQLLQQPDVTISTQFRYRHKDGSWRWLEGTGHNLLAEPGVQAIVANYRDITERKRAEEELRKNYELLNRIFATTHFCVVYLDRDFNFVRVNKAYANACGYPPEFFAGKNHFDLYPGEKAETIFRNVVSTGTPFTIYANPFQFPDHPERGVTYWDWTLHPLMNEEGYVEGLLFVLLDVTKRKRAEEERAHLFEQANTSRKRLQILSQQLIEAQEIERRHIARELHDEIGQVLTAVRVNLQTIQLSPDPSTLGPRLEESISIVEHALRQVRDLSLDLRPSLLDDFGLAPALEWYVDRQAERSGFTAQFVAVPPEMQLAPLLETACFRVAQAALTNVTRHAQAKQVRVELHHTETELRLVVRDDGIGFDVDTVLEHAAQGASLGLLGMRERAQLAGGQIEIESAPMNGTEIRVRFPFPPSAKDRPSEGYRRET
ncbi:MAG: PAS domain S-box protein [Chloroflexi bacterium]|nr:PAS domain S-box protein [Chloroflexota bacterium]